MNETPMVESSAMLSNAGNMKNVVAENQLNAANKRPDSFRWCNYYKKPGHTKDMCWKLHGRTLNFNNNNRGWRPNSGQQQKVQGQANFTNSNPPNDENETPIDGEFKEDIERLKRLLESLEKPSGACSLALSGKRFVSHAFNVSNSPLSNSWVIDSDAMDHMTTLL